MQDALDAFRARTENTYIPRSRLEELATKFKDGMFSCDLDEEEYDEFFDDECDMTDDELDFFGMKRGECN